jgi:hypothetical protein
MKKNIFVESLEGEEAGTSAGAAKGWETRRATGKDTKAGAAKARAKARSDAFMKKSRDKDIAFSKRSMAIKKGISNKKQRDAWSDHIASLSKAKTAMRRSAKQTESAPAKGAFRFHGEECYGKGKK